MNAVEPGTKVEIHRHPKKDELFVLLRGRVRVNTYNDDGSVKDSVILNPQEGLYGLDISKGVWHKVESLESGSVFLSVKRDRLWGMRWKEYWILKVRGYGLKVNDPWLRKC